MPIHNMVACLYCTPDQTPVSLSKMDLLPIPTHTLKHSVFLHVCACVQRDPQPEGRTDRWCMSSCLGNSHALSDHVQMPVEN